METVLRYIKINNIKTMQEFPKITPRQVVLVRDAFRCTYCDCQIIDDGYEIDHMIPICRGGEDNYKNKTLSCRSCNQKKGKRTNKEFIGRHIVKRKFESSDTLKTLIKNDIVFKKFIEIYPDYEYDLVKMKKYFGFC